MGFHLPRHSAFPGSAGAERQGGRDLSLGLALGGFLPVRASANRSRLTRSLRRRYFMGFYRSISWSHCLFLRRASLVHFWPTLRLIPTTTAVPSSAAGPLLTTVKWPAVPDALTVTAAEARPSDLQIRTIAAWLGLGNIIALMAAFRVSCLERRGWEQSFRPRAFVRPAAMPTFGTLSRPLRTFYDDAAASAAAGAARHSHAGCRL